MKTKKMLSLIIALCMIAGLLPLTSFAEGEETRTMEIVVNAGEGVSIWNDSISSSGVTSNDIRVTADDGTEYDIVFPKDGTTAAAFSMRSEGLKWHTADYIKPDTSKEAGMLTHIYVKAGKATLSVRSHGDITMVEFPLKAYKENGSPLSYIAAKSGQFAEYILPEKCSLSNITLTLCGTDSAELKRTVSANTNSYDLYKFEDNALVCRMYTEGKPEKTASFPYIQPIAYGTDVYKCATIIIPAGADYKNLGEMKITEGNVVLVLPKIPSQPEKTSVVYPAADTLNNSESLFVDKTVLFGDIIIRPTQEGDLSGGSDFDDLLFGGSGGDSLTGGSGDDPGSGGGSGDDPLSGGDSGALILYNSAGTELVMGGSGRDELWGGSGSSIDSLEGGRGYNEFFFGKGDGMDVIVSTHSSDVVSFNISIEDIASLKTGTVSGNPNSGSENQNGGSESQNGGSVTVSASESQKLTVTGTGAGDAIETKFNDGSTYNMTHSSHQWNKGSGNTGTNSVTVYEGSGSASDGICSIWTAGGQADRATGVSGDTVNLTATVPAGRRFVAWRSNPDIDFDKSAQNTSAVIPEGTKSLYFFADSVPIEYGIAVNASSGGSLNADKAATIAGSTVNISVSPDRGYALSSLFACGPDGDIPLTQSESDPNCYSFTMPIGAVTVSASFEKLPYTVETSGSYCTLSADKAYAASGDTVTLTVSSYYTHRHLASLTVLCGDEYIGTEKTGENTYTFTMPAGNVTANAVYIGNAIVFFRNWNGRILGWGEYNPGETPVYSGATPEKAPDAGNTYTFSGWDRQITAVDVNEEEVNYTAVFTPTPRSYTVSFMGPDGNALQSGSVLYGETPEYTGDVPALESDGYYIYTFSGWRPQLAPVTGDAVYRPVFEMLPVLRERANYLNLVKNEEAVFLFTPKEDGWYRFLSKGDEIHPECSVQDENGNYIGKYYDDYNTDGIFNFEFLVELEGGKPYRVSLEAMRQSGNLTLYVRNVDMHTVTIDQDIENGTVIGEDPVSYLAYTGQIIYPWAEPDPGYGLLEKIVTDENGKRLMEYEGGYIMPDSNVSVTAVFAPTRTINMEGIAEGIGFSNNEVIFTDYSGEEPMDCAAIGAGIEMSFDWDGGKIFDEFSLKTESGEDIEYGIRMPYTNRMEIWFTMPDENIVITANVAEARRLSLSSGAVAGYEVDILAKKDADITIPGCLFPEPRSAAFVGWATSENGQVVYRAGDSFTSSADTTLYAVWRPREYTETTVTKEAGNTVCSVDINNTTGPVTVIAAAYLNGRLVTALPRVTSQSSETFTFTGEPDTVKVFVFDNMNNLKPLSILEEKGLK